MGCCGNGKAVKKGILGIKPSSKRGCTDCLMLLIFLAFWVCTIGVIWKIFEIGDPDKMLHGIDMQGRVCGRDPGVKEKPYAAWPWPEDYYAMICVENCNETMTNMNMTFWLPSVPLLGRYCLPRPSDDAVEMAKNAPIDLPVPIPEELEDMLDAGMNGISDLQKIQLLLAGSAVLALVIATVWVFLLRCFAGVIVYTIMLSLVLSGALGGYIFYTQSLGINFFENPTAALPDVEIPAFSVNVPWVDTNITYNGFDYDLSRVMDAKPDKCSCATDPAGAPCEAALALTCNTVDPEGDTLYPEFCITCNILNGTKFLFAPPDEISDTCHVQRILYAQDNYKEKCDIAANNSLLPVVDSQWLFIAACAIWILTVLFIFLLIALRKRIAIAVEVVKEASTAYTSMLALVIFPILPLVLLIIYIAFWLAATIVVLSLQVQEKMITSDTLRTNFNVLPFPSNGNPEVFERGVFDERYNWLLAVHFFGLLWNIQVIMFFGYMCIAGAVADWYFTPRSAAKRAAKEKAAEKASNNDSESEWVKEAAKKGHSRCGVASSCCRTFRFHLGTVAVCALIIAIIQFCRAVLVYIQAQRQGKEKSKMEKALFACLSCYLKCLEKCMNYVSKNTLIWTSIYGDGFCTACVSSFQLIWANLARVAALNMVSGFLLLLSKVVCSVGTTVICVVVLDQRFIKTGIVTSALVPGIVIFVLSYLVCTMCLSTLEVVIDTIFFCFLVDCEQNDVGTMLASPSLQKLVNKYQSASTSKAAGKKQQGGGGAAVAPSKPKEDPAKGEE